ncbi:putative O-linked N-acetylglucosamine transferase (SPINDLY family) [Azospirillum sp. OGB3]|uniref:O-linked N-acetylglucosamine transferase, SPINDLY family protein n=1 Tax=Azospirillum sp. OGB3 TaxID=2587012 RepID=UPI001606005B|nr:glycosyltransferase family 41 protein [Azospirillum sp. OGB3]MBB3264754.1 putative O-linked N-acetylglucosamine transferase (SPINDLY family) [Azospirillum sp. OGB3]
MNKNRQSGGSSAPDMRKLSDALALAQKGDLGRAVALFDQATRGAALTPQIAGFGRDLHAAVGNAAFANQRYDDALSAFELARRHDPNHPGILLNIGNTLFRMGAYDRAAGVLEQARSLQPASPDTLLSLSAALFQLGRLEEAERRACQAAAAAPNAPAVWFNLGTALKGRDRLAAATDAYRRALRIAPQNPTATVGLIQTKQRSCDWSSFDDDAVALESIASQGVAVQASMMLSHRVSAGSLLEAARAHARTIRTKPMRLKAKPARTGVATIAYLSNDFRQHPVAQLLAEVLALHDRSRFQVLAYSYGPEDDGVERRRIREGVDRFIDIDSLTAEAAAETIRRDGVDLLIDLKGYTGHPRPHILAAKPAPVQVQFLGYPGTLGAPWIDYIIADPIALPPELESGFTEAVARMPRCFLPRDRRYAPPPAPPRAACGLPADGFVLACFNNAYKITPEIWSVWMALLRNIPDAVLWLARTTAEAEGNLLRSASAAGVAADRIVFAPWAPTLEDHLSRLQNADLMLDTLYYGAHTTASDALWVGLPVVTCPGRALQSRVAASLLHTAGLPDFATESLERYGSAVFHWANNRAELEAVRNRLRAERDSGPLFDMNAYTRLLDQAFLTMLDRQRQGKPPAAFTLAG